MESQATQHVYRIANIRPWSKEETDEVPEPVRTFFEGKEGTIDDLRALAASFGAGFESIVQGGARFQASIDWQGHRYDLDLDPIR